MSDLNYTQNSKAFGIGNRKKTSLSQFALNPVRIFPKTYINFFSKNYVL